MSSRQELLYKAVLGQEHLYNSVGQKVHDLIKLSRPVRQSVQTRRDVGSIETGQGKSRSAGIDGVTIQHIVQEYGEEQFVIETQQQLLENVYRPKPVRRKDIPKGDGKTCPLGIPVIRPVSNEFQHSSVAHPLFHKLE